MKNMPLAGTSASLLTPAHVTHSSFPYTMTLTLNPLVGSIASTYSVRPTPNLALSSRCDFNFYSWESRYVVGAEVWRGRARKQGEDPVEWAREKLDHWFTPEERALKDATLDREEENVLKFRIDDSWHMKALWTGRIKALLVSVGVGVSPVPGAAMVQGPDGDSIKRWSGTVGASVAYST
jgi:distribution and morphology protein 10